MYLHWLPFGVLVHFQEKQEHKFDSESHNMDFLMKMYEGAGFLTSMSDCSNS